MGTIPLLTGIVPRRSFAYVALLFGGIALVGAFGGLYALGLELAPLTTDGKLAAFDLDAEGSLASWFSIVLLFGSGLATLLIRRLRAVAGGTRRESRLWLAVSLVWFTMSADEAASLHEGFKELAALVTGTRIFGDGSIYWAVPYFLVLSATGWFLLRAVRQTPVAVVCLGSAGAYFAIAVAVQIELVFPGLGPRGIWLEESFEMLGDLYILLTLGFYARSLAEQIELRHYAADGRGRASARSANLETTAAPREVPVPHFASASPTQLVGIGRPDYHRARTQSIENSES